ncbi:hypothetical protein Sru01_38100 [Sphaerisporangium rufum]|uniref:Uncharacterized protein n=1 Tax=Sphaerisporangium rufum TaxID=1381558 RepID=A0A919R3V7_9ACTN|nr:DUF6400 family protein [Sphaerisporangium rufum]GII78828.1 hypothetical protein Sru01_38100 [Sphaerisporangium rufum]
MTNAAGGGPAEPVTSEWFEFDLAGHEARRRAEVLAALGPGWDPPAAMRAEDAAAGLLYSGLDAGQRATYRMLVAAGVLPPREGGAASDAADRP